MKLLDYIKNDGATQYINTGFNANQNTRVVMEVKDTGRAAYWFGAWNSSYNSGAYACCNDYGGIYSGYDGQGGTQGSYVTGNAVVDMNKNVVSINGSTHRTFSNSTFQVNYPLYLFGQNRAGTFAVRGGDTPSVTMEEFKLVSCQIYDNGTLVRDFVPAMNDADNNKVGLLEKVSGTFYERQGSNEFSYGQVISGYKPNGTAILSLANYTVGGDDALYWTATIPTGTSVAVSTSVNNGAWQSISNAGAIQEMPDRGQTCNLRIKIDLATTEDTYTPAVSGMAIRSADDKKVLVLTPNIPNFSSAVGNVTVSYDGLGGLGGTGGPTAAFDGVFTPSGLTWKGNQNAEEHIEVNVIANVALQAITYTEAQDSAEHIEVNVAAIVTLTNIHDL